MPEMLKLIRLRHITSRVSCGSSVVAISTIISFSITFLHPQLLDGTVVEVYEKLGCFNLLLPEYERRALSPCLNVDVRRFRSIFCLFRRKKEIDGAECSSIKIKRHNIVLNSYKKTAEITFGDRYDFNAILHNYKLFVFGEGMNGAYLKCVSRILEFDIIIRMMNFLSVFQVTSYDLGSCTENLLPEMHKPRDDCTPIALGKYIFVLGGYDGKAIYSCER